MKIIHIKKEKSKGFMIFSVMFIVLISFIGLTLLNHTITHTRIVKSRLKKIMETEQITRELVFYLHYFREKIFADQGGDLFSPDLDYFNKEFFPDTRSNQVVIKNNFKSLTEDRTFFKKIRIQNTINACSARSNRCLQSGVAIDILSGNIPFTLIPFFIHKKIESPEENYLDEKNIEIIGNRSFIAGEIPIDFNISSFLIDLLKITGEIPSWSKIREKFDFEISEEPIEEGLYFITEENTVESLFIQGDVQRLIFSTIDGFQKVEFYFKDQVYELKYKPDTDCFYCWDDQIRHDSRFKEKMVVNGNVWSLEQKNYPAFVENANITLLVSGQTIIKTSLGEKNLDLQKMNLNHLTLICCHHALYSRENNPAKVTVESAEKTEIQVSVLVNGTLENDSPELKLSGSLYAKEVINQGKIEINFRRSGFDSGAYFQAKNLIYISDFFIDFIEESLDAE